jgi:hypothetical protein
MPGMIERVALDALLLRTQLPELSLREGTSVVARVASRGEGHGVIVLAGVPLTAQLPPEVQAGQTLHLRIAEVTPEQVTRRLEPQSLAPPAPPPASVALSFDSAVLGRVDLRIDLARGIVSAGIAAAPGAPLELATGAAGRLESALSAKTGRAARVRVMPRREPFDAYA